MEVFYWEPEWPDILKKQEEILRWTSFSRADALALGLELERSVREDFHGNAAIRIIEDGDVIFSYKMPGTSRENDWWMDRKLAVTIPAGVSSLRAYVEAESGQREAFWQARPDNFAACGGCIPVFPADGGRPWAYVLVSGLEHWQDHQVIAQAMARRLGVQIPKIRKK